LVSNYITTFLLTLSNPATILSFAALYAGLGFSAARASYPAAVLFIVGVFCGSAFWWLGLSSGVNMVRHTLRPIHLRWLNRLSGLAIAGFGLLAIATVPLVHRVP
jgi:threonine/homoserine/homoserine lactone efflux protein